MLAAIVGFANLQTLYSSSVALEQWTPGGHFSAVGKGGEGPSGVEMPMTAPKTPLKSCF